jgi:hypothetical protein
VIVERQKGLDIKPLLPPNVTLYDVPDGGAVKTLTGNGGVVRFSPDGQWLARGSANGIALWNLASPTK